MAATAPTQALAALTKTSVNVPGYTIKDVVSSIGNEHLIDRKTWDPVLGDTEGFDAMQIKRKRVLCFSVNELVDEAESTEEKVRTLQAIQKIQLHPRLKKAAPRIPVLALATSTAAVQKNKMGNIPSPADVCQHMMLPDEGQLAASQALKFMTLQHQRLKKEALHMAAFDDGGDMIVTNQRILFLKSCNEGTSKLTLTPPINELEEGAMEEPKFKINFKSKSEVRFQSIWLRDVRDVELYMVADGAADLSVAQKQAGFCGACGALCSCFAACCECCKPLDWAQEEEVKQTNPTAECFTLLCPCFACCIACCCPNKTSQVPMVVTGENSWAIKIVTATHLIRVVIDNTKEQPTKVLQAAGVIQQSAPWMLAAGAAAASGGKVLKRKRKGNKRRATNMNANTMESTAGPTRTQTAEVPIVQTMDGGGGGGDDDVLVIEDEVP